VIVFYLKGSPLTVREQKETKRSHVSNYDQTLCFPVWLRIDVLQTGKLPSLETTE
jgi:hypothetical protein